MEGLEGRVVRPRQIARPSCATPQFRSFYTTSETGNSPCGEVLRQTHLLFWPKLAQLYQNPFKWYQGTVKIG